MTSLKLALIIASNRTHKSYQANLKTILQSPFLNQLILVNKYSIGPFTHSKLIEVIHPKPGVSRARNIGIRFVSQTNDILAFTDDDCVFDDEWLQAIQQTYHQHPETHIVFGQTRPYQPEKHPKAWCPCTFSKKPNLYSLTTQIGRHWETIGYSNNMAVKSDVFQKLGGFKEWLGPGSIGSNAEDVEFSIRCILKGFQIGYEPKMLIFHNKWLKGKAFKKQQLSYFCGENAAYGFFAFQGNQEAYRLLKEQLHWHIHLAKKYLDKSISQKSLGHFAFMLQIFMSSYKGLVLGLWYSLNDYFISE